MLSRQKILYRQKIPANVVSTTWAAKHVLSPTKDMVENYIKHPSNKTWKEYEKSYLDLIESRFKEDRSPFDDLAQRAGLEDVFLGCYCPTKNNPDVYQCHTVLALRFMKQNYSTLEVLFPESENKQPSLFQNL